MGRHSIPESGEPSAGPAQPGDSGLQGRRRRVGGPRRGVSVGVIAALVTVVALVGGVILWRFFGDVLSRRSSDAADACLEGTANVAVVADPTIADSVRSFAEDFNRDVDPVGDTCIEVTVTQADSDTVLQGLTADWPADLGGRPAVWIPASSVQPARLQAALGKQVVTTFHQSGASRRCKAFFQLAQFFDQGIKQLVAVFQQQGESLSFLAKIICLLTQAFLFQACEPAQWHG